MRGVQNLRGAVAAAVVDADDLIAFAKPGHHGFKPLEQDVQHVLLVIGGDDEAQGRDGQGGGIGHEVTAFGKCSARVARPPTIVQICVVMKILPHRPCAGRA